jgi:MFS family permease
MSTNEETPLLVEPQVRYADVPKQQSAVPTPLPKLQFFTICFIQFAEPVTAVVIYPFIVHLVRDTGITGGDDAQNGYYAGFIVSIRCFSGKHWYNLLFPLICLPQESLFYASEALTTLQWGRLSDRIGRKPPLVLGMLGLAAAMTGFGLSTAFVPLLVFRSLQGVFNGNIGITKAVMAEITDSTNMTRGSSTVADSRLTMLMSPRSQHFL